MSGDKVNKKKLQSIRTREKILEAAVKCFGAKGFPGCSLDTIAEAAEISKGAIYTHFASKSELFISIINHAYRRALDKALELEGRMSRTEAIIKLLAECMRNPEFPINHKLWAEILALANRDAEVLETFQNCQDKFRGLIEKWLLAGIRDKDICADIDVPAAARLLFVLGNGLIVRLADNAGGDAEEYFKIMENAVRILLLPLDRQGRFIEKNENNE